MSVAISRDPSRVFSSFFVKALSLRSLTFVGSDRSLFDLYCEHRVRPGGSGVHFSLGNTADAVSLGDELVERLAVLRDDLRGERSAEQKTRPLHIYYILH